MRHSFAKNTTTKAEIFPDAPPILSLKNSEKFRDADGNAHKIQIRGTRNVDGCFFKIDDIYKMMGIKYLHQSTINSAHQPNIHYVFFNSFGKQIAFFTYQGVLNLMFSQHNSVTHAFTKWATHTLFNAANYQIGVPISHLKCVLKTSVTPVSCIYLFCLGSVKSLKSSMNLSQTDGNVYKFGRTRNLAVRTNQHAITFGAIKNTQLTLVLHGCVDVAYTSQAEKRIHDFMNDIGAIIKYKSFAELVVLSDTQLKRARNIFEMTTLLYANSTNNTARDLNINTTCTKKMRN